MFVFFFTRIRALGECSLENGPTQRSGWRRAFCLCFVNGNWRSGCTETGFPGVCSGIRERRGNPIGFVSRSFVLVEKNIHLGEKESGLSRKREMGQLAGRQIRRYCERGLKHNGKTHVRWVWGYMKGPLRMFHGRKDDAMMKTCGFFRKGLHSLHCIVHTTHKLSHTHTLPPTNLISSLIYLPKCQRLSSGFRSQSLKVSSKYQ